MNLIIDFESRKQARRQRQEEVARRKREAIGGVDLSNFITKEEFGAFRAEVEARIAEMRAETAAEIADLRQRVARVERLATIRAGLLMVSGAVSALAGLFLFTL